MLNNKELKKKIISKQGERTYKFIEKEILSICKICGCETDDAFEIFSNALLTGRSYDNCKEDCLDDKDGGVDSFFVNHDKKELWLIQSKLHEVDANAVDRMKMSFTKFIEGEHTPGSDSISLLKIKQKHNYSYKPVYYTTSLLGGHKTVDGYNKINVFKLLKNVSEDFSKIEIILKIKLRSNDTVSTPDENSQVVKDSEYVVTDLSSYRETLCNLNEYYYEYLFDMNLRGDVRDADRIKAIEHSIKNFPDRFELYNNGVTIICDDMTNDKKTLNLVNPKIINGQQTTRTIKNYKGAIKDEARVMIKVIKTNKPHLITKIAEYSNSQSKINDSDLISCHESIKKLKTRASEESINIIIKSGKSKFLEFDKVTANESIKITEFIKTYYIIRNKEMMGNLKSEISSNIKRFVKDNKSEKWTKESLAEIMDTYLQYKKIHSDIKKIKKAERPIELNNINRAQLLILRSVYDGHDIEKTITGIKGIIKKYRKEHGDEMNIFKNSKMNEYYDEFFL